MTKLVFSSFLDSAKLENHIFKFHDSSRFSTTTVNLFWTLLFGDPVQWTVIMSVMAVDGTGTRSSRKSRSTNCACSLKPLTMYG